jgi:hypothetical protein
MDGYFLPDVVSGVFIMLPVANPTMTMLKNTQIIPRIWPNTNPPSSHKITAMIIDITSRRVLESIVNLSK